MSNLVDMEELARTGRIVSKLEKDIKLGNTVVHVALEVHAPTGEDSALLQAMGVSPATAAATFLAAVVDGGSVSINYPETTVRKDVPGDQRRRYEMWIGLPDVVLEHIKRAVIDHLQEVYRYLFGEEVVQNLFQSGAPSYSLRESASSRNGSVETSGEKTPAS